MNIFDFAMQMEKDGESYYRELAKKSNNKGLESILNMLADEEVKHYNLMKVMKSKAPDLSDTQILKDVKNIFAKIKESPDSLNPASDQKEAYQKAQKLEQQSEDFYRQKANEMDEEGKKSILLKIAEEEKKHYFILENIIEFISRPDGWLEDAEFNKLEDY